MSKHTQINPLIEDTHTPEDTINNVQSALDFIADSLAAIERDNGLSKETTHGANCLIRCCMAALDSVKSARFAN